MLRTLGIIIVALCSLAASAEAATITFDGRALGDHHFARLHVTDLPRVQSFGSFYSHNVTDFNLADGSYLLSTDLSYSYGTVTINGGAITASTGGVIALNSTTVGFDATALAAVTVRSDPLTSPAGKLSWQTLEFGRSAREDTLHLAPGLHTVLGHNPFYSGGVYGSFTVDASYQVTNVTGALAVTQTGPRSFTVDFDLAQLVKATLRQGALSSPPNLLRGSLDHILNQVYGDVVAYLPEGTYGYIHFGLSGHSDPYGSFSIDAQGAVTTTGALVASVNGPNDVDISFDASQLVALTLKPENLSVPAGLVRVGFANINLTTGGTTLLFPPGDHRIINALWYDFGTITIAPDLTVTATDAVTVTPTGPNSAELGFDLAQLTRVTVRFPELTDPPGLLHGALREAVNSHFGEVTAYLAPGSYEPMTRNGHGYGRFEVEPDGAVSVSSGALIAAADGGGYEIGFDLCALNQVRITNVAPSDAAFIGDVSGTINGSAVIALPDGNYQLYMNGPFPQANAGFSLAGGVLSATLLPDETNPLASLELEACAQNGPPTADAGPDQSLSLSSGATLSVSTAALPATRMVTS